MISAASCVVGLRVMIVDSHQDSLDLATAVLEELNINVLPVQSAKMAMQALRYFEPEVLICELCLPEEDGYTFMQKVNAYLNCQNQYVPAIALTTQVSDEAKVKALSAGFCRHIAKPYQIETLVETVAQLAKLQPRVANHCVCCA